MCRRPDPAPGAGGADTLPRVNRRPSLRRRALTAPAIALCALALAACGQTPVAQAPAEASPGLAERLDRTLAEARAELGVPGVSAALIIDGESVWLGSAGVKRLGAPEPVTPATRFLTASTAKTVTAAIVLVLVDRGRVRLRAPVARYLPRLVGAERIRVIDLLRHTSGLPDYLYSRRINGIIRRRPQHRWTRGEVLRTVRRLSFPPGGRYSYSNTNYIALGGIIERVTGSTVQASFERLVADRLGLGETDWRYDSYPIADFARPYVDSRRGAPRDQWPRGFVPTDFWGEVWTDGGLATTAKELGAVANALIAGDLLRPPTRRAAVRFGRGGAGLGVFRESLDGRRWIGHDGLYAGFSTQHWTEPRGGATISVMSDLETAPGTADSSWAIWKRLARAFEARPGIIVPPVPGA